MKNLVAQLGYCRGCIASVKWMRSLYTTKMWLSLVGDILGRGDDIDQAMCRSQIIRIAIVFVQLEQDDGQLRISGQAQIARQIAPVGADFASNITLLAKQG